MLASLMFHQVKDYHHLLVYISLRLHPDFLYALVWRHIVFFIVFNTSNLLLFCISLSCVDGISCFPFHIQIFIFATARLPQLLQSSFLRYILTDLFIPPPHLFLHMPFFVDPQVFSVSDTKLYFNFNQILLTWGIINCECRSSTNLIPKISLFELPYMSFWNKFLTPISAFYNFASQINSFYWVTHSLFGVTFTSHTNLIFCCSINMTLIFLRLIFYQMTLSFC